MLFLFPEDKKDPPNPITSNDRKSVGTNNNNNKNPTIYVAADDSKSLIPVSTKNKVSVTNDNDRSTDYYERFLMKVEEER